MTLSWALLPPALRVVIGMALGALAGLAWWRVVGCSTGTCPLTATPLRSALYGAFMGLLATFPHRAA